MPRYLVPGVILILCVFGAGTAGAAPAGWFDTATGVLPNLPSASGTMAPARTLDVTLVMTLRNADALRALVAAMATPGSPAYRSKLSPAEFVAGYAPTTAQVAQVTDYLTQQGFSGITVSANRLLVTAQAPASLVSQAFKTTLSTFSLNGRSAFANTAPVRLPLALQGLVTAIAGVQDVVTAHTGSVGATTAVSQAIPIESFPTVYAADSLPAADRSLAIFMAGDITQVQADLQTAAMQAHLNSPSVTVVSVGSGTATTETTEWDLDSQSTLGMAGSAPQTWYVAASLANSDLLKAFNRWVSDDSAPYANASFGECETDAQSSGLIAALDPVLTQAAAQGQTLFVASGDNGTPCASVNVGSLLSAQPALSYPASSPYVIAVAGTSLSVDVAYGYLAETAWSGSTTGISAYESSPSWQQPVVPTTASAGTSAMRGVPDMAMDGAQYRGEHHRQRAVEGGGGHQSVGAAGDGGVGADTGGPRR